MITPRTPDSNSYELHKLNTMYDYIGSAIRVPGDDGFRAPVRERNVVFLHLR